MGYELSRFTVVYDACRLYPAPLRDLLVELATAGLFRAKWTALIHGEWVRNLLRDRPDLGPEQLRRTSDLMNSAVPDCKDFPSSEPARFKPDAIRPDDFISFQLDLQQAAAQTGACDA